MIWVCIIVIALLVLGIRRGIKGPVYTLDKLQIAIDALLKRGYDCGFLIISISYTNKFLQLRKYINAPGNYGVQLGFPKAKWSLPYFDKVKSICQSIDPESGMISDGPLDFFYIDFGKDVSKAHECVKRILIEVFGVTHNTKLFVTLEKSTVKDELIDKPQ